MYKHAHADRATDGNTMTVLILRVGQSLGGSGDSTICQGSLLIYSFVHARVNVRCSRVGSHSSVLDV